MLQECVDGGLAVPCDPTICRIIATHGLVSSTESSTVESKDEGHSWGSSSLREFPEEVNITYHWRMDKMEKRNGDL